MSDAHSQARYTRASRAADRRAARRLAAVADVDVRVAAVALAEGPGALAPHTRARVRAALVELGWLPAAEAAQ